MNCIGVAPPVINEYKERSFATFEQKTLKYVGEFFMRIDHEDSNNFLSEVSKAILTRINGTQGTDEVRDQLYMLILIGHNKNMFGNAVVKMFSHAFHAIRTLKKRIDELTSEDGNNSRVLVHHNGYLKKCLEFACYLQEKVYELNLQATVSLEVEDLNIFFYMAEILKDYKEDR